MSQRWLSGILIFVLGFVCPSLAANARAQEVPEDRGELAEGLSYINTGRDITLVNTGKDIYLVMVQRESVLTPAEVLFSSRKGVITVPTYSLSRLVLYRLDPIWIMAEAILRPCMGADCSFIGPLPPPPPPTDFPDPSVVVVLPQQ